MKGCDYTGTYTTTSIKSLHMKEQLQNNLEIQKAVKEVMEKNISKWQKVPALNAQYDKFIFNLKKIEGYLVVLKQDLAPLKEKRELARKHLVDTVFTISGALGVYAADVRDRKLMNLLKGKLRDVRKLKPEELIRHGKKVAQHVESLLENDQKVGKKGSRHPIRDYGITEKLHLRLQSALENFQAAINGYWEASLDRKKSKVKLVKKIRDNEILLKQKMDRMIHLFKDEQKAFYQAYIQSRLHPAKAESADEKEKGGAAAKAATKKVQPKKPAGTPATTKSATDKAAASKPATRQPASGKPAVGKPAATKPATGKAATTTQAPKTAAGGSTKASGQE